MKKVLVVSVLVQAFILCCLGLVACGEKGDVIEIEKGHQPTLQIGSNGNSERSTEKVDRLTVEELVRSREVWKSKKIKNYRFVIRYEASGVSGTASPVMIEVRNGIAILLKPILPEDKRPMHKYADLGTVEKLFDWTQLKANEKAYVWVRFDSEFGYPSEIKINNAAAGGSFSWSTISVERFEALGSD